MRQRWEESAPSLPTTPLQRYCTQISEVPQIASLLQESGNLINQYRLSVYNPRGALHNSGIANVRETQNFPILRMLTVRCGRRIRSTEWGIHRNETSLPTRLKGSGVHTLSGWATILSVFSHENEDVMERGVMLTVGLTPSASGPRCTLFTLPRTHFSKPQTHFYPISSPSRQTPPQPHPPTQSIRTISPAVYAFLAPHPVSHGTRWFLHVLTCHRDESLSPYQAGSSENVPMLISAHSQERNIAPDSEEAVHKYRLTGWVDGWTNEQMDTQTEIPVKHGPASLYL